MMRVDRFGVLSEAIEFELPGQFRIAPVPAFAEVMACLRIASDPDGTAIMPDKLAMPRRSQIYQLPSTHQIEGDLISVEANFRSGVGQFILGLFSILFECRLQWEGLWFDGYVRSKNFDRVFLNRGDFAPFFEQALAAWGMMSDDARSFFLQAEAFHQRANGYAHGFEVFFADYTALEAIWHFGLNVGYWKLENPKRPFKDHYKRLRTMALALGILDHDETSCSDRKSSCENIKCTAIRDIYSNRNDLFHQADWEERMGIMSGTLGKSARGIHLFTKRVLIASLGFRNDFTRSTWNSYTSVHSIWTPPHFMLEQCTQARIAPETKP